MLARGDTSILLDKQVRSGQEGKSVMLVTAPYKSVDRYERLCQVGEGTYGKVYKAKCKATGQLVALKMIRVETEIEGFPLTAVREVKLLRKLDKRFIVDLKDIVTSDSSVFLVFEYLPHDIAGLLLHPQVRFSHPQIKCIMHQLLEALEYLHEKKVVHRDMKGSNLLIGADGKLKLADFGLAKNISQSAAANLRANKTENAAVEEEQCLTNRVITIWYRPPELLLGSTNYGAEVDMWGAGCIFGELWLKKPPFQGNDEISQLKSIFSVAGFPPEECWKGIYENLPFTTLFKFNRGKRNGDGGDGSDASIDLGFSLQSTYKALMGDQAYDLFVKLLNLNPAERLTATQALNHPYFREEPQPCDPSQLGKIIDGDWHEFETKQIKKRRSNQSNCTANSDSFSYSTYSTNTISSSKRI